MMGHRGGGHLAKLNVNRLLGESRLNGFHWVFFSCCLLVITFDGYDLVVYGASIPLLMKHWAIGPAYAGVIGTYALVGTVVGALTFGRLADRIGRKRTIVFCAVAFSLGMGFAGLCPDPVWFGVFRFIAGLGIGGCMPNVVALATEWSPARHRVIVATAIYNGMQVGGVLAAGIGMWLLPIYGWRSVYLFGTISLLLIPALVKFLPEAPALLIARNRMSELTGWVGKARPDLALPADAEFEVDRAQAKSPIAAVFQENRALSTVMFWIIYFCTLCMIYGLGIWLPKLMMNAGYPLGSSLRFLLTFNLGSIVGNCITAAIADRIGAKRMITILCPLGFIAVALLSVKTNPYMLSLLVALAGTFTMGTLNIVQGYVALFYPPSVRSTGLGLAIGLGRLGGIAGPTIGGILLQFHASSFQCFLGFAIPGLISFIAILAVQDRYAYTSNIGKRVPQPAAAAVGH